MNQPTNTFPLFFTLERVENGYILKCREESSSLTQEPQYRKEVVTEDKIDQRIGHLLRLDSMKKEIPLMFYVEAVTENAYKPDEEGKMDDLLKAKLTFYLFKSKGYRDDKILALQVSDSGTIEVYGGNAEKLSLANDLTLTKASGISLLRFPSTKDGRKLVGGFRPQVTLLEVSEKDVMDWYLAHRLSNIPLNK